MSSLVYSGGRDQGRDNPTLVEHRTSYGQVYNGHRNESADRPNNTGNTQSCYQRSSPLNLQQRHQIAQVEWAKLFQTRKMTEIPDGRRPILLLTKNQRHNIPWRTR